MKKSKKNNIQKIKEKEPFIDEWFKKLAIDSFPKLTETRRKQATVINSLVKLIDMSLLKDELLRKHNLEKGIKDILIGITAFNCAKNEKTKLENYEELIKHIENSCNKLLKEDNKEEL